MIAYLAQTLPVSIYMLGNYFRATPPEIEESAMVDGCTRLQVIQRVTLPLSLPAAVGGEVVIGMRPVALTVPPRSERGGPHLTVRCPVEDVEYLGAHYLVRCRLGTHTLVALPDPAVSVRPGDVLPLALPLASAHLFHPDSGIRLNLK